MRSLRLPSRCRRNSCRRSGRIPLELRLSATQRYIGYFLWYDVFVGDGLRSDGEDDLPLSTSVCSILPIARLLRAGLRHAPARYLSGEG
jgi:hypothetical protein